MSRTARALFLLIVMAWQTLSFLTPFQIRQQAQSLGHAVEHLQALDHHHHEDQSLHADEGGGCPRRSKSEPPAQNSVGANNPIDLGLHDAGHGAMSFGRAPDHPLGPLRQLAKRLHLGMGLGRVVRQRQIRWVVHKYLLAAAEDVLVKGVPLSERLHVPESFNEANKAAAAIRRRDKLSILRPHEGHSPLAIVMGEFKASDATAFGRRVWIKHMPDAPLLVASKTWERIERVFAPLFEARDADSGYKVRLVMAALIRSRREHTYEIDAASFMLASEQWIPVERVYELALVQALVAQHRRFIKPLRYDAKSVAAFPNALLLDAGPDPVPLHLISPFMSPKERTEKERAANGSQCPAWAWSGDGLVPALPSPPTGLH